MREDRELIRIARVRARLSQQELADKVGYSRQVVFDWEKGTRTPRWGKLYAVLLELKMMKEQGCQSACERYRECLLCRCPYLDRGMILKVLREKKENL